MNEFPFHIPFRQLTDYAQGRLPLTQRMQIEAHVATCVTCSAKVARLKQLMGLQTDTSDDAPLPLMTRVKKFFQDRAVRQSAASERRGRILAVCHFDSRQRTGSFGVRAGRPGTRQLLFSTGVSEIDLRIEPAGLLWAVSGQILGESVARGRVILESPLGTTQAHLNELSEFNLPSVEAGTYRLILNLENVEIEIDELRIGM
jgi:anti-sigma factor RsiW